MAEMLNILEKTFQTAENFVSAGSSSVFEVSGCKTIAVTAAATVTTPTNKTFLAAAVDITANTITKVAHGYLTGLKVQFSNPTTLPTGISALTNYFIIKVDADTFKVAASLADALAGTAVDITDAGVGTNTTEVTALADASAKLQKGLTAAGPWFDEGNSQAITVAVDLFFEKVDPSGKFYKLLYAVGAGQITVTGNVLGKGEV